MSTHTTTHTKTFTQAFLIKPLVKRILETPLAHEWSIQGLGMLRTYLTPNIRLHIWDEAARAEGASKMHTHPWDFYSAVVAGRVHNFRYKHAAVAADGGELWKEQEILCGVGGGLTDDPPKVVRLLPQPEEIFVEGDVYMQEAEEIHASEPEPGTVTIITRQPKEDQDHAFVYFKDEWVTAEPRPATKEEAVQITNRALELWF